MEKKKRYKIVIYEEREQVAPNVGTVMVKIYEQIVNHKIDMVDITKVVNDVQ